MLYWQSYLGNGHITDEGKGRSLSVELQIVSVTANNDGVDDNIDVRQVFARTRLEEKIVDGQTVASSSAKSTADPGNCIESGESWRNVEITAVEVNSGKYLGNIRRRLEFDLTTSSCNGSVEFTGDNQLARNYFNSAFGNVQATSYIQNNY